MWDGQFDFLSRFFTKADDSWTVKPEKADKMIRISVDYEIIWTAGAGRNMWIHLNNNQANAGRSIMSTNSQIMINPLTSAQGSRETAVTTLNVHDLVNRKVKGFETMEKSLLTIIALSNGGSIYLSGIRIEEYEE
jgi:hypothetical protein